MRMFKQGDLVTLSENLFFTKALQHGIYRIHNIVDSNIVLTPVNQSIAQKLNIVVKSQYINLSAQQIELYNKGSDVNGAT